jgi:hypothetical protein
MMPESGKEHILFHGPFSFAHSAGIRVIYFHLVAAATAAASFYFMLHWWPSFMLFECACFCCTFYFDKSPLNNKTMNV